MRTTVARLRSIMSEAIGQRIKLTQVRRSVGQATVVNVVVHAFRDESQARVWLEENTQLDLSDIYVLLIERRAVEDDDSWFSWGGVDLDDHSNEP